MILQTKDLAVIIRQSRKLQGLTQEDLAGLSGLGRRFISELENGKQTAQIGKVFVVLNILGIGLQAVRRWESHE
jgi:HTH-type transcriptional regulator/antitoxin HipB